MTPETERIEKQRITAVVEELIDRLEPVAGSRGEVFYDERVDGVLSDTNDEPSLHRERDRDDEDERCEQAREKTQTV